VDGGFKSPLHRTRGGRGPSQPFLSLTPVLFIEFVNGGNTTAGYGERESGNKATQRVQSRLSVHVCKLEMEVTGF
jgi:hypothetical protein